MSTHCCARRAPVRRVNGTGVKQKWMLDNGGPRFVQRAPFLVELRRGKGRKKKKKRKKERKKEIKKFEKPA